MHKLDSLSREFRFAIRDRILLLTLLGATVLSTYSLLAGLKEIAAERAMIERTQASVTQDREYYLAKQTDVGGAAYYAFHFTYDPPSALAFISRGVRDDLPWRHRIRMLALEGQIYETDAANPTLSKIGKLDYSFITAFLIPLLLILLLYDLRASEIRNNRWAFLSATVGNGNRLLLGRAALRSTLLYLCVVAPFVILAMINGVGLVGILSVAVAVALSCIFWCLCAYLVFIRTESGPTTAAILLACWFVVAVVVPVAGKHTIERLISVPQGGEILLNQREAVNDAWDLPKSATMEPFLQRHPEWSNTPDIAKAFEWKWYYAFQQVGDQTVESDSQALRDGIAQRDKSMGLVALVSPPLLTQRLLSRSAETDVAAFLNYDACVRRFHKSLRDFHYPMMFGNAEYSDQQMSKLPTYTPCTNNG